MTRVLYHNPRCSKSRELLGLLEARDVAVEVVDYLKTPLSRSALATLVSRLGESPAALIRKDARFEELGLAPDDYVEANAVVDLLVAHPELMQRPVLVVGERAAIGRPAEQALALL